MINHRIHPISRRPMGALILAAALAALAGCSMSGRIATMAEESLLAGDNETALALALEALEADPGQSTALEVAAAARPAVIAAREESAQSQLAAGRTEEALVTLRSSIALANRLNARRFFTDVDSIVATIAAVASAQGEALKDQADTLFADGRFEEALALYLKALAMVSSTEMNQQIGECYYAIGDAQISRGQYRAAIDSWEKSLRFVNNADVRPKLSAARYQLGVCYLQKQNLRLAAREFRALAGADPNFIPEGESGVTISRIAEEVQDRATRRISVNPFGARAGVNPVVAGTSLPTAMQEKIHATIQADASEFIRLLRADSAQAAFQAIQQSRMNEAASATVKQLRFEVGDFILGGELVAANLVDPAPTTTRFTESFTLTYFAQAPDGSVYPQQYPVTVPYEVTEDSIALTVTVTAALTDVQTNRNVTNPSITTEDRDSVRYISRWEPPTPDPTTGLTVEDVRNVFETKFGDLLTARRETRSASDMVTLSQESVAARVAAWVLQELDQTPSVENDPEPCAR